MKYKREIEVITDTSSLRQKSKFNPSKQVVLSIYSPDGCNESISNKINYLELFKPHEIQFIKNEFPDSNEDRIKGILDYLKDIPIKFDQMDVKESNEKLPVIIFSPGFKMDRDSSMFIIEKLLSKNFIVITLGHAYETPFTYLPNGKIIKSKIESVSPEDKIELILERAADIELIVKMIHSNESNLINNIKMDNENIFLIGHSFGGAATYKYANTNKNVKGIILWDASFQYFDDIVEYEEFRMPVLNFRRGTCNYEDEIKKFIEVNESILSEEVFNLRLKDRKNVSKRQFDAQKKLSKCIDFNGNFIKLNGSEHMSFTDFPIVHNYNNDNEFDQTMYDIIADTTINFIENVIDDNEYKFKSFVKRNNDKGLRFIKI